MSSEDKTEIAKTCGPISGQTETDLIGDKSELSAQFDLKSDANNKPDNTANVLSELNGDKSDKINRNSGLNGVVANGSDCLIYHEKQCRQMCAKHALNNLLQSDGSFTKTDLDLICYNLSPNSRLLNPHKSAFGFGNYDINVIISALHSTHLETIWFDKRKDPKCLELDNIKGFILNIPNPIYNSCKKWTARSLFALPTSLLTSRKHWIAIRSFGDLYYNLDSKLDFPELIGNKTQLIDFLREKNSANDTEIFVIVSEPIAESLSWIRNELNQQ